MTVAQTVWVAAIVLCVVLGAVDEWIIRRERKAA